jgi:hypothetical protein
MDKRRNSKSMADLLQFQAAAPIYLTSEIDDGRSSAYEGQDTVSSAVLWPHQLQGAAKFHRAPG